MVTVLAILAVPGTLSGWVYRANYPLRIVEEKLVPVSPNGAPLQSFDNSAAAAAGLAGDAALPAVWRFLRAMEGYDANRENEDWAVATQMAAVPIADAYRRERDPARKEGRSQKYKRRTSIVIERDTEIDVCDASRCDAEISGYALRFFRVVYDNTLEQEVERIPYEAVVRFRRDVPGFTYDFVRQFNPLRVQVTSYTKGQPLVPVNTRFPG